MRLFTGLAVEELEKKWEEHPVLHLDLNARKYTTPADLDAILNQHLERWEAVYGEEKRDRASEERFLLMSSVVLPNRRARVLWYWWMSMISTVAGHSE